MTAPKCSICARTFSPEICFNAWTLKHGNQAWPINSGKCCDICDRTIVLPARARMMKDDKPTILDEIKTRG